MVMGPPVAEVFGDAQMSPCEQYRYILTRRWGVGRSAVFVMLNPSTADAATDDPTIRRCVSFARREGCSGITVVNLYAFRATGPADMLKAGDPVGPANDVYLVGAINGAADSGSPVIAAWGANGNAIRARVVVNMAWEAGVELMCLGVTKGGSPRHPLYVRGDTPLVVLGADVPGTLGA